MVLREVIPELQRGLLPADVHHRSAIIQLVCDRLSAHLQKDTLSASAVDVRWGPCSFCPRDAISIYCRIAGKKEWSEITVLTLVWDVRINPFGFWNSGRISRTFYGSSAMRGYSNINRIDYGVSLTRYR